VSAGVSPSGSREHSGMDAGAWVPAVVAGGFALLGAFGGQFLNGKQAARREDRAREHENYIWARSARYEAHVQFLKTYDELDKIAQRADDARRYGGSLSNPDPPDDFLVPLWDRWTTLRLVSERATTDRAKEAVEALADQVFKNGPWEQTAYTLDQYIGAVRAVSPVYPADRLATTFS
jgi:hypothetical protein